MTLTEEFQTYPSERATKWLQAKKLPWTAYGPARSCKAVLSGDTWGPAPYTEDGKTPHENGVDVILFPLVQEGEIINIVAFEPSKPGAFYMRNTDCNLWSMLDFIGGILK